MKMKLYQYIKGILLVFAILFMGSCGKEFLNNIPQGELSDTQVESLEGVEATLLGAYSILNGNVNGTWGNYGAAPSQWLFGEVASDNAHKGSESLDQPFMNAIESLNPTSANDNLETMWQVYYEGVIRSNKTLSMLNELKETSGDISEERAIEIEAEAKMLRGHYYFFLWRIFKNIPYIDETVTVEEAKEIPNDSDVIPHIISDLEFAVDHLPTTKINGEGGRVDKVAAQAYLGKVLLYQKKYPEALALFNEVIGSTDLQGLPYQNNFNVLTEDGPEAIFVSKHAINSNGSGDNSNVGDMLSGLYGTSPVGCCGFYQPTIDLVNAFRVDANGLPLLDNSYRDNPYLSDLNLSQTEKASYSLNKKLRFDPRLDYTVGRRGVPYLDYGVMPGDDWIRDSKYAGPFVGIKTMIPQSLYAAHAVPGEPYLTGLDVNIIRLADVYLMAAECEVELNNLGNALKLVNDVRKRASNLPPKEIDGVALADYQVKPYPSFPNQDYAREAVRFERRLELAMEGHRYFDLVRWGIAKEVLESYSSFEGQYLSSFKNLIYNDHNSYFPIPQTEIDRSGGVLVQHDAY